MSGIPGLQNRKSRLFQHRDSAHPNDRFVLNDQDDDFFHGVE
jgi:hypothetical protein